MRVLVVGAGAVGAVYGHHLARGGAEVAFFVKPQHVAGLRDGIVLYRLNRWRGATTPVRWQGFDLVTTPEEVAATRWDQVWLTVSSPALEGPWLPALLAAAPDATVVMLQPGLDDRALVLRHVPEERLVQGLIVLISYTAPLPGEARFPEPGVAYWFPFRRPSPFSGPRARDAAAALRAGRQPASVVRDLAGDSIWASGLMQPWLLALEAADWSFAGLRARLPDVVAGAQEAFTVLGAHAGREVPAALRAVLQPGPLALLLALAPRLVPLDLEPYLRVHFTKVGDQTMQYARRLLDLGREHRIATPVLARLVREVAARRA